MLAAVVHGLNDIRIEPRPRPRPGPGELLVRVGAAGVCATDVKQLGGLSPPRKVPSVLGHELAGIIAETGEGVRDLRPGQRVAVYPIAACGKCFFCRLGRHSLCEKEYGLGHGVDGAFAEYCNVPAEIPAVGGVLDIGEMPFEIAALTEPLSCAISARRQCRTSAGDTVAVVGCGPMGQLNIYASRRAGARVIALDYQAERLKAAADMGAEFLINPGERDATEAVRDLTGGRGADVVIVAVGFVDAVVASFPLVRSGGIFNVFGGTPRGDSLELDPRWLHYGEILMTGTFGSTPADFVEALNWLREDPDTVSRVISHTCRLDGIVAAVERVRAGQGTKTMVLMGED